MTWKDKPIGYYEPFKHIIGESETTVVPEGEIFWMIKTGRSSFYDTSSQDVAVQYGLMCEINEKLRKLKVT